MPSRIEQREILPAHPRDQLSYVSSAEIKVANLRGFSELDPVQQEAARHFGGTMAEFCGRRTFTYGLPGILGRDILYSAFVSIEQVLDEEDSVRALGVPERFIRGAYLISFEQTIIEVCERNSR